MIQTWRIEVEGTAREVYLVRAETLAEAMQDWKHGLPISTTIENKEAMRGRLETPEEICGETFDHDLREFGEGTYECRRCGAEIFEEGS